MTLKIKTSDIELEYSDEVCMIDEQAKNRILAIINQIYMHQRMSDKPPHILASEFFGEVKK
jgi:hypothetical protein